MDPYQLQMLQQLSGAFPGQLAPATAGLFDRTAMQYAANSPAQQRRPVDVSPLAPLNLGQYGPLGALAGVAGNIALTPMFQNAGMVPMGNAASFSQAQREHQYNEMQRTVSSNLAAGGQDAEGIYRTLRGVAAVSGMEMNADQRQAFRNVANQAAASGQILNMFAPGMLDAITGPRGSIQGLAGQMMEANRYVIDPTTGRIGLGEQANTELTQELFNQMYAGDNYLQMSGIRAGEAGELYKELQARGQLGLGPVRDRQRAAVRAVQDAGGLQEALADAGIDRAITDASELSSQELTKLAQTDAVRGEMTSADASRIKNRLQGYSQSIAAMREVFGENGDPNAPIPKLIGALEGLTQGNIQKFDSNNLNTMVRDLQSMSQISGLSLDQLAARQQSGVAALDRVMGRGNGVYFSPTATNLSVSQGMGYGQLPGQQGFGAMNQEASGQAIQRQFARGMGSETNNLYAALSVMERTSGFDTTTRAGRQLQAINDAANRGETTYEFEGQTRPVPTRARDVRSLVEQGGASGMDVGDFNSLLGDRATLEREMAENPELQTIALNNQYEEITRRQERQVANRIASSGALESATPGMSTRERNRISRSLSSAGLDALQGLSLEDQQDREVRQAAMVEAIQQQAANEGVTLSDAEANAMANATFGEADTVARSLGFEGGNFEMNQVLGRQATDQRNRNMQRIRTRSRVNEAMSGLGPSGSVLNRFVDAIQRQGTGEDNADLQTLLLDTFGADSAEAQERLLPEIEAINAEKQAIEDLQESLNDPNLTSEQRTNRQNQINDRLDALDQRVADVQGLSDELGIDAGEDRFGREDVAAGREAVRNLEAFTTMDQARNLALTSQVSDADRADFADVEVTRDDSIALATRQRREELDRIDSVQAGDLEGEYRDTYNDLLANNVDEGAALARVRQNMRRDVRSAEDIADEANLSGFKFGDLSEEDQRALIRNRRSNARMAPTDEEISARLEELESAGVTDADSTLAEDSLVAENMMKAQGLLGADDSILEGGGDVRQKISDAKTKVREESAKRFQGTQEEIAARDDDVAARLSTAEGSRLVDQTNENIEAMSNVRRELLSDDAAIDRLGVSATVQAVSARREAENNLQSRANKYFGGNIGMMVGGGMMGMDEQARQQFMADFAALNREQRQEVADYLGKDAADLNEGDYRQFLEEQNRKDIATMGTSIEDMAGAVDFKQMAADFSGQLGFEVTEEDISSLRVLQGLEDKPVGKDAESLGITEEEYQAYMQGTASDEVKQKVQKATLFGGDKEKLGEARDTRKNLATLQSTLQKKQEAIDEVKAVGGTPSQKIMSDVADLNQQIASAQAARDKQMQEAGYDPANPEDVAKFEKALDNQGTVATLEERRKEYDAERQKLRDSGKSESEIDQMLGTFEERQKADKAELERLQELELTGLGNLAEGLGISTAVGEEGKGLDTLRDQLGTSDTAKRNQRLIGSALSKVKDVDSLEGDTAIEKLDSLTDQYRQGSEADRKKLAQQSGMSVQELDRMMSQTEFLGLGEKDMADMSAEERAESLADSLREVEDRDIGKEQQEQEDKTMKIVGELVLDGPDGRQRGSLANATGSNGTR